LQRLAGEFPSTSLLSSTCNVGTARARSGIGARDSDTPTGCHMGTERTESELRQFYEQWAAIVSTFCRLYLGDSEIAEEVLTQTFLQYFRRELPLRLDHIPSALMSLALEESNSRQGGEGDSDSGFESTVLQLPPRERAVFILHGVLSLQLPCVAAITRIAYTDVCRMWVRALLELRVLIVRDSCSRLFDECGPAPGACA
jgi:DNA-directed RNA polymerase specialized sigma24 family protein